ncbi:phosphatase PAP2 family protein [Arthrobacter sp. OAP107]|uniref:phosphatase PAP2 family protein n=1 Tax=Arthrobacter sp. OAP107 TaxID=3156445 RepID=UPI003394B467
MVRQSQDGPCHRCPDAIRQSVRPGRAACGHTVRDHRLGTVDASFLASPAAGRGHGHRRRHHGGDRPPGPSFPAAIGIDDARRRSNLVVSFRARGGGVQLFLIGAYLVFSRSSRAGRTIAAFGAAAAGMLLEATSRIYLGYHWFTDTVGSVSVSTVLLAAVIAVDITRGERSPGEEKG